MHLVFPQAAAAAAQVAVESEVTAPPAGSVAVIQERDHRAWILWAFDAQLTDVSGRPDGMSGERLETCKAGMPPPAHRHSAIPVETGQI